MQVAAVRVEYQRNVWSDGSLLARLLALTVSVTFSVRTRLSDLFLSIPSIRQVSFISYLTSCFLCFFYTVIFYKSATGKSGKSKLTRQNHFTLQSPSERDWLTLLTSILFEIPQENVVRYLGLHLDSKLNWQEHFKKKIW